jgi:hypothetical protein
MKRTAPLLALALAAPLALAACSKSSDDAAPAVVATTAPPVPTARCPAGSAVDGAGCKGSGQGRVATLAWNGAFGDSAQVLTLRNVSGAPLKNGAISIWFYDRTGKRLDEAGAKKYAAAGDAFASVLKAGESRNITVPLAKGSLPDGTAEIEAEVVKVTLVNGDGSDGMTWKNDDLNADERAMVATPSAAAPVAYAAAKATATASVKPGHRLPPPPPPAPPGRH